MSSNLAYIDDISIVNELVIHKDDGIGKVSKIADGRATIDIGRSVMSSVSGNTKGLSAAAQELLYMVIDDEGLRVTIPEERLYDNVEWTLAPSKTRFLQVCNEIESSYSQVVVPTLNPRNPVEAKEAIAEQLSRYIRRHNRAVYDDRFVNLRNQVMHIIDSQLSYFLIRGDEGYRQYQERLRLLESHLDTHDAWSEVVRHESSDESNERLMHYAKTIAHINVAYGKRDYVEAVSMSTSLFEARIELYSSVIAGFTRSKGRSSK